MAIRNPEFNVMLKEMIAWIQRREREGWSSPEEERAAHMVRLSLWTCAQNKGPPRVILESLHRYVEDLNKARGLAG